MPKIQNMKNLLKITLLILFTNSIFSQGFNTMQIPNMQRMNQQVLMQNQQMFMQQQQMNMLQQMLRNQLTAEDYLKNTTRKKEKVIAKNEEIQAEINNLKNDTSTYLNPDIDAQEKITKKIEKLNTKINKNNYKIETYSKTIDELNTSIEIKNAEIKKKKLEIEAKKEAKAAKKEKKATN